MRACVIFNPTARGEGARRWLPFLHDLEGHCELLPTTFRGAARSLARKAVEEGFETIVAAGGDGTVNEVVNGIGDAPEGFLRARLGVLPMGTVNVFARELGIPSKPKEAWRVIDAGIERLIDLPSAQFLEGSNHQSRAFAQLAGAGLDARAVELVNWQLKKKLGVVAYIVAVLQAYAGRTHQIRVETAQGSHSGEAVLIGNGHLYGGNHPIFHRARLDDGLLDICIFRRLNARTLAQASLAILTGNWHKVSGIDYLQSRDFRLQAEHPTPLELEGDSAGQLPAHFHITPHRVRVLHPAS